MILKIYLFLKTYKRHVSYCTCKYFKHFFSTMFIIKKSVSFIVSIVLKLYKCSSPLIFSTYVTIFSVLIKKKKTEAVYDDLALYKGDITKLTYITILNAP